MAFFKEFKIICNSCGSENIVAGSWHNTYDQGSFLKCETCKKTVRW